MQTYIHLGMNKTGSTLLQEAFSRSRKTLLQHGVLYPNNPPDFNFNNHRLLVLGQPSNKLSRLFRGVLGQPTDKLPRHFRGLVKPGEHERRFEEFIAHVRDEIASKRPDCVLMSSETLFSHSEKLRLMRAARRRHFNAVGGDVTGIVYVRRPSAHFISLLQQNIRHRSTLPRFSMLKDPDRWTARLTELSKAFGEDRLHICVYDRASLIDGDILADFVGRFLADYGLSVAELSSPSKKKNPSVSGEGALLLMAYRGRFYPDAENQIAESSMRLVRAVVEADSRLGFPKARLKPALAEQIDYGSDAALRLRDKFGIRFPDFDYERLEAGRFAPPMFRRLSQKRLANGKIESRADKGDGAQSPIGLEDIVEVRPAAAAALAEYLLDSEWAGEAPEHGPWLREVMSGLSAPGAVAETIANARK